MNQLPVVTRESSSLSAEPHKTKTTENHLASANPRGIQPARFHSADSLRAGMMFLGIVLHGAIPYSSLVTDWPIKDPGEYPAFYGALIVSIHAFRMPLFFLLAGFFANLLNKRLGPHGFLKNRTKRILLPFIFGWLVLYTPVVVGVQYALNMRNYPWEAIARLFTSGAFLSQISTMHLWFLYYLFYFYLFTLVAGMFSQRLGALILSNRTQVIFRRAAESNWRALIFAVPTFVMLYLSTSGSFGAPAGWLPDLLDCVTYICFYTFGWYLFAANDLLKRFEQYAWTNLVIAIALITVEFFTRNANRQSQLHVLRAAATAIICWCMIFSLLGLGNRCLNSGSRRIRYAADSSYWVYLVHYPIVLWLQAALTVVHLPSFTKFLLVISITSAVSLGSYALFVRYTFIGHLLNGVRHRPETIVVTSAAPARS